MDEQEQQNINQDEQTIVSHFLLSLNKKQLIVIGGVFAAIVLGIGGYFLMNKESASSTDEAQNIQIVDKTVDIEPLDANTLR